MPESVKGILFDCTLTLFVLSPLVVFYWSSTWTLLDMYLLPSNKIMSAYLSLGISYLLMVTSYFTQDILNSNIRAENSVRFAVVSRLFTYIMSFAMVNNWRGLWMLLDTYTPVSLSGAGINIAVGVIGLVILRSYRNVLAPPGAWILDMDIETHFTMMSRFRSTAKKGSVLYLLDIVFGVLVLATLVVLVWRGKWLMLEHILAKHSEISKGVITTTAGNLLIIILFIAQYPARKLSIHLHSASTLFQIVFEDAFLIIVCTTSVTYWLGNWKLLNALTEGFDPFLVQWLIHVIGFGGMMMLRVCTSLQFKGYFIDGEFPQGIGLIQTPTYYSAFLIDSRDVTENLDAGTRISTASTVYEQTIDNLQ